MSIKLSTMGQSYEVEIRARRPSLVCAIDEREVTIAEAHALSDECNFITVDGQHYQVWRALDGDTVWVHIGGRVFTVEVTNPLLQSTANDDVSNEIRSDMPGMVVEIHASKGATVARGDAIVTIESMKMQIVVHAPRAGTIEQIHYQCNTAFDKGAVLVSLEAATDRN